ncbi:unnamed protein product [Lactuca saligna]|uniref:Uncharacterized protein n=1 Tax=Lactuca saligna TaxID=75948 RepID=A0AA35YN29_LACSI|nr:unnamed protein product [Lactuca saligna]
MTINSSTSQQPQVERSYMSRDTSTMSIKKNKTSTKTLMKHIICIVADLTSKVDHVLKKKDKPNTLFSGEDMVNEEDEETYHHGKELNYDDTFIHGLEVKVGLTTTWQYVEPSPDVVQHHKRNNHSYY